MPPLPVGVARPVLRAPARLLSTPGAAVDPRSAEVVQLAADLLATRLQAVRAGTATLPLAVHDYQRQMAAYAPTADEVLAPPPVPLPTIPMGADERRLMDAIIADPDADATEYRRMATVVRDASIRANTLVESLLLLARTEAQSGRRLVRKQPADLSAGVSAALSTIEAEVKRLGLRVEVSLGDAPVVGDPSLLDRLAGNLIENAVRYNHYDGRLEVRTGSDDRHAWLVVANTGFEVDAADVPGLFEPFSRGGRERTGVRGSGLGLSIVRAVCDAHGGSATAVALAGGGLEVTVRLPAAATTPLLTASVPGPGR